MSIQTTSLPVCEINTQLYVHSRVLKIAVLGYQQMLYFKCCAISGRKFATKVAHHLWDSAVGHLFINSQTHQHLEMPVSFLRHRRRSRIMEFPVPGMMV